MYNNYMQQHIIVVTGALSHLKISDFLKRMQIFCIRFIEMDRKFYILRILLIINVLVCSCSK